jgi:hypothetical protein
LAKRLLTGERMTMDDIARASLNAASMPAILQAYKADMTEASTKITALEEQIKKMQAAQPGGGGTPAGGEPEDNGRINIKPGMKPHEASTAWAKAMSNLARGG